MKLRTLAWRNLWRRKRRTLITAFSIAFGVLLTVTFTGTGDYVYTNMIDSGARMGLGHISIQPPGYQQSPALDKRISGTRGIIEQVRGLPGVTHAAERISGQAMFASAHKSIGGIFMAVDPGRENPEENLFMRSLSEGRMLENADERGIIIGSGMARKLKLKLGKKIIFTTTDASGEIVSDVARVRGIFTTGVDALDSGLVMLPINLLRHTLSYQEDEATLVAITIRDQRYTDRMLERIRALPGNEQHEVLSWRTTQPDMAGMIAMDRSSNYVTQFLIGLLIAAGIFNTLLMSVLERTREFGAMMAIGMSPALLFRMVMLESLFMAFIGLILGVIITAPWFWFLAVHGIDFSGAIGDDYSAGGVLIDPVMKARLYKESVIAILGAIFSLTLAAGIFPAWKAGRIPPVESLKTI